MPSALQDRSGQGPPTGAKSSFDPSAVTPPPRWLMPGLIAVGLLLRLVQYLWNLSYFHDEICLLWNIRARSGLQLLGPLDHNQAAPPLFLVLERIVYLHLGESEMAMRLPSFAAACLAIVFFAILVRRMLTPWTASVALWLFICSGELLSYSALLKPYELDALLAVMMSLLALDCRNGGEIRWIVLCLGSAVCVWLSYPVILIFAGISLALVITLPPRKLSGWLLYGLGNLVVAVSFFILLRKVEAAQHTRYMTESWEQCFLPISRPAKWPQWFYGTFFNLCNRGWKPNGILVLPLALIGAVTLSRNANRHGCAILAGPILMNLVAAAAARYPFDSGRLTLYLLPAVLVFAAAGAGGRLCLAGSALQVRGPDPWHHDAVHGHVRRRPQCGASPGLYVLSPGDRVCPDACPKRRCDLLALQRRISLLLARRRATGSAGNRLRRSNSQPAILDRLVPSDTHRPPAIATATRLGQDLRHRARGPCRVGQFRVFIRDHGPSAAAYGGTDESKMTAGRSFHAAM